MPNDTLQSQLNELLVFIEKNTELAEAIKFKLDAYDIKRMLQRVEVATIFSLDYDDLEPNGDGYYRLSRFHEVNGKKWRTHEEDTISIGYYAEGKCQISCPEDGKQPQDVWLLKIGFPTGGYYFTRGTDVYLKEFFTGFFDELKTYSPAYIDTLNSGLYYLPLEAKVVCEAFPKIKNKYERRVDAEIKRLKLIALEREVALLKGGHDA